MKKVTKLMVYNFLFNEYSLHDKEENRKRIYARNIATFLDKIYDLTITTIEPLTENQTFIFRKKIGVLDKGMSPTNVIIAKELGFTYQAISLKLHEVIDEKLPTIIYNLSYSGNNYVNDLSVEDRLSLPISEIGLPKNIYEKLQEKNINTLQDLITISTKDISKIKSMGKRKANTIIDLVHSYNLQFSDEEKSEELRKIMDHELEKEKFNQILQFPISVLELSKRSYHALTNHGINTISDLINLTTIDLINIPCMGSLSSLETIDKVHELELKFKDESMEDVLKISDINKNMAIYDILNNPIETLGFSNRTFGRLKINDINNLYDLISEPITRLVSIKGLGTNSIIEIMSKVSEMGLCFVTVDEKKKIVIHKKEQVTMLKTVAKKRQELFEQYTKLNSESVRLLTKEELLDREINEIVQELNKRGKESEHGYAKKLGGNSGSRIANGNASK